MASLPLPALYHHPDSAPEPSAIVGTATSLPARLSALEWSIVAMAERDGLSSIRELGRYTRPCGTSSVSSSQTLWPTNGSRRCDVSAIFAWHYGWNVPKSELAAFFGAGFTSRPVRADPEQHWRRRAPLAGGDAPDEYDHQMCSLTALPSSEASVKARVAQLVAASEDLAGSAAGRADRRLSSCGNPAERPVAAAPPPPDRYRCHARSFGKSPNGTIIPAASKPARAWKCARVSPAPSSPCISPTELSFTKGQLLFTIDPRPFVAALAEARAAVASARSDLSLAASRLRPGGPAARRRCGVAKRRRPAARAGPGGPGGAGRSQCPSSVARAGRQLHAGPRADHRPHFRPPDRCAAIWCRAAAAAPKARC